MYNYPNSLEPSGKWLDFCVYNIIFLLTQFSSKICFFLSFVSSSNEFPAGMEGRSRDPDLFMAKQAAINYIFSETKHTFGDTFLFHCGQNWDFIFWSPDIYGGNYPLTLQVTFNINCTDRKFHFLEKSSFWIEKANSC